MNKKGQSSIEFILLVSVAMIYISTIILPSVEISKRSTEDVMQLSQARLAAEKLANTIDSVAAASGNAKTTVTAFVPSRAQITCLCDATSTVPCGGFFNEIKFDFVLTENDQTPLLENPACPKEAAEPFKSICSKSFQTISAFECQDIAGDAKASIGDISDAPTERLAVIAEISVEKTSTGIVVKIEENK